MSVTRRAIPELKIRRNRKGLHFINQRNYPTGTDYIRMYQNDSMVLEICFDQDSPKQKVVLHTNLYGDWEDIPFDQDRQNGQRYTLSISPSLSGVFQFKVKYSFNDGRAWFLDSVPHSNIFVDPESMRDLRLYTLIPTVSGHIGNWIGLLHHIKSLGFNGVHLLPITELDVSESPYSAADFFSIDPSYAIPGDKRKLVDQFEEFVEEAKSLGIKLCFDIVLNHVGISSKMSINSSDWISSDSQESDGLKRAGCWDNYNWVQWRDLVLIKYDHPNDEIQKEIWDYMTEYLLFWANYANYTGGMVRLDNLHSTDHEFLAFSLKKLREVYPNIIIFAELFTDPKTSENMVFEDSLNLLLATPWVTPYAQEFRGFIRHLHNISKKIRYFLPLTSHDSGSPAQEYGSPYATMARYAACAFLGTGQTGIVQATEFGIDKKIEFIGRKSMLPMFDKPWGIDFEAEFKKLHSFLDTTSVFSLTQNIEFVDYEHGAVLGALRFGVNKIENYLVLANLDVKSGYDVATKYLPDYFEGRAIEFHSVFEPMSASFRPERYSFYLNPCEVKIFRVTVL